MKYCLIKDYGVHMIIEVSEVMLGCTYGTIIKTIPNHSTWKEGILKNIYPSVTIKQSDSIDELEEIINLEIL